MAPSALGAAHHSGSVGHHSSRLNLSNGHKPTNGSACGNCVKRTEFLLDRNLHKSFPVVRGGKGNLLHLADGRSIFDTTCGAGVSCLGYGDMRVVEAVYKQMSTGTPYVASTFFASEVVEQLCAQLIAGTGGEMARVYLTGSGKFAWTSSFPLSANNCRVRGNGGHYQVISSSLL